MYSLSIHIQTDAWSAKLVSYDVCLYLRVYDIPVTIKIAAIVKATHITTTVITTITKITTTITT